MVSLRVQRNIFVSHSRFCPWPNDQDKICHMVASEKPEVIEGKRRLISVEVVQPGEAAEDGSIDDDGAGSYEDNESGLG